MQGACDWPRGTNTFEERLDLSSVPLLCGMKGEKGWVGRVTSECTKLDRFKGKWIRESWGRKVECETRNVELESE